MQGIDLSHLRWEGVSLVSRMSPDELLQFAATRKACIDQLQKSKAEIQSLPADARLIVSEEGNYASGKDVFEAFDQFVEKFPDDRSQRASCKVGDIV
ncbi:MAG: hypothetical protein JWO43_379 [Candidatus Adlerbacteria bacterium]|nr:hypothetical protein [Candidatus Adlerbacteria bacterium]